MTVKKMLANAIFLMVSLMEYMLGHDRSLSDVLMLMHNTNQQHISLFLVYEDCNFYNIASWTNFLFYSFNWIYYVQLLFVETSLKVAFLGRARKNIRTPGMREIYLAPPFIIYGSHYHNPGYTRRPHISSETSELTAPLVSVDSIEFYSRRDFLSGICNSTPSSSLVLMRGWIT